MEPLYSPKQLELINTFRGLIAQHDIELVINPVIGEELHGEDMALDVEHDESGTFVGCGLIIVGTKLVYYFSDIHALSRVPFSTLSIVAHNGLSDLECLRHWGINVWDEQLIWDTMLIGHILDSSCKSYGLKDMAKRELGIEYPSYDDIVGKRTTKQKTERVTLDKQPLELVALYNAMDCYATEQLYQKQILRGVEGEQHRNLGECDTQSGPVQYFNEIEKLAAAIFQKMQNRGICVDLEYLKNLKISLEAQQQPIKEAILNELGPINLNSPKQLLEALHAKEIYPILKGKPSTDKRALAGVPGSIVSNLLAYSELDTLLSSFVLPYLERNQTTVHPFFNQCGTRTGRLSCSNPNLLQIPRRTENGKLVRRMFIPRDGMVMGDCDFNAIEPRVLAHLSKDPALCSLFNENTDFHGYTAERLGIDRDRAKILNLSVGYRATFKSVASQLKCSDKEAQNEIDKWWALFPTLRRWQDVLIRESKGSGFCTTLLGRRIRVDGLSDYNKWKREAAERQLINNITQGSAAEIMKMAMIAIQKGYDLDMFSPRFGILVQIYDELLFESDWIDHDKQLVQNFMESCIKLDVPLIVECKTGDSWASCH